MNALKLITRPELDALIARRAGETKLGEKIRIFENPNWQKAIETTQAQFVLVGIPEDIGVRANRGTGGTHTLWQQALKNIVNVQHTDSLDGNNMALLGAFDFSDWMATSQKMNLNELRAMVAAIDDVVYPVIQTIAGAGKIPIVIGGGHNNAYPILKGVSRSKNQPLHCINLDAHSDYRAMEGRHSGNGFRYARMDGYLQRYAVIGLHRNYNSQNVITELLSDSNTQLSFYEDIFLEEKNDFGTVIDQAIHFTAGAGTGIEIDLDCIEKTLSSAATPCGITTLDARKFLLQVALCSEAAYLHIPEGCAYTADGRADNFTAKLVSYLVTDFIRVYSRKSTVVIHKTGI